MAYNRKSDLASSIAAGGIVAVGVVAFVAFIFAIGTALTALLVALVWNWIGLHELFDAPALTFWQVVGVAIIINIIRSIFTVRVSS